MTANASAMFSREEFLAKMHVEELDTHLFRGNALQMGLPRVFGGQVLGQALNAAVRTVEADRKPHSLHGYFLRPGDLSRPILYEVDPIRNGRSFSTRRVVGKQKGEAIFNASISFQIIEDGYSHQLDLPSDIPHYKDLQNDWDHAVDLSLKLDMPVEDFRNYFLTFGRDIMETRTPELETAIFPREFQPSFGFWFRFNDEIGDDPITHRTLLAFISDKALMGTALRPHPVSFHTHKIIGASLDHAMWFHEEFRVNQWIYYHLDSPRSAHSRGFNRGSFYTEDGRLICSTAQEGLIRVVGEHKAKE